MSSGAGPEWRIVIRGGAWLEESHQRWDLSGGESSGWGLPGGESSESKGCFLLVSSPLSSPVLSLSSIMLAAQIPAYPSTTTPSSWSENCEPEESSLFLIQAHIKATKVRLTQVTVLSSAPPPFPAPQCQRVVPHAPDRPQFLTLMSFTFSIRFLQRKNTVNQDDWGTFQPVVSSVGVLQDSGEGHHDPPSTTGPSAFVSRTVQNR